MKNIYLLLISLMLQLVWAVPLFSQIKAVPDNYYVRPGFNSVLDVLVNDDPGNCANSIENLKLEIVAPSPIPSTLVRLEVSGNKISFRSRPDFVGQIKVTYKISCPEGGVTSSTSYAYINVSDKPDFIDDAECTIDPVPFVWDIEKKAQSDENSYIQSYATPFVGDLDGDGVPEIVTLNAYNAFSLYSNEIMIFDNNLQLTKRIPTPLINSYVTAPIVIADVAPASSSERERVIVLALSAGSLVDPTAENLKYRLVAYKPNGDILWVSSDTYIVNHLNLDGTADHSVGLVIADIDGDGYFEILAGDRIFAAESGKLLATLPEFDTLGKPLGRGLRFNASGTNRRGYLPVLADIDGDGKMEAVCGNTTYKISINSRTNPQQNAAVLLAHLPIGDGYTSVADIDGDGILDVVVISSYDPNYPTAPGVTTGYNKTLFYAWQGSTASLIGNPQTPTGGKNIAVPGSIVQAFALSGSRPFIGDINNDGKPEVCFTSWCKMDAYAYNSLTKDWTALWTDKYTSDTSAATTMSMFDFNNDGEVELVYRDETHIRILDKNGNNVKDGNGVEAIFACHSGTHTEYPVIVDLKGDGHAVILVSGSLWPVIPVTPGDPVTNSTIRLMLFGSKTPNTWAPARRVWNQHAYNPLWINEDLTVPTKPMSLATELIHKDGVVLKPFNSFLQQAGILNTQGESLNLSYDLAFVATANQKLFYNETTKDMQVSVIYTNSGAIKYEGKLKFALYAYDKSTSKYMLVGTETTLTNQSVDVFETKQTTFKIANFDLIKPTLPSIDNLLYYVTVNLDNDAPNAPKDPTGTIPECNTWNNRTGRISYVSGKLVLCEGTSGLLQLEPAASYDCYWFTVNTMGVKEPYPAVGVNLGDTKDVTKSVGNYRDYYLIDLYVKGTLSQISTDTAFVYMAPDTLIWKGTQDTDWHNVANWEMKDDTHREKEDSYIPRLCTDVIVAENVSMYPNLENATNYAIYTTPMCNSVTLEPGSEILGSYKLDYTKAYVQLELLSNRWYCYTPPLQNFYAGDFYVSNPNPNLDSVESWTRLFSQKDPQWNIFKEGAWSKSFNNPDYSFTPGEALGVWIDDKNPSLANHQVTKFHFPQPDTEYYIYYTPTHIEGPFPISRDKSHRFLYEKNQNATTKSIGIEVEATKADHEIMIGNPLMSHLDFDKFYAANSQYIQNRYRIMDINLQYPVYFVSGGVSTGGLTKNVAPMQAIIITPKKAFPKGTLQVTTGMALNDPANKLKSTNAVSPEYLNISVSDKSVSSNSLLIYSPNTYSTLNYDATKDVPKMMSSLSKTTPSVYIESQDGVYTDIKQVSDLNKKDVKIGLRYSLTGKLALNFDRLWNFMPESPIYLYDAVTNKTVNLRQAPIYTFEKNESDVFVNNRFVLRFGERVATGLDLPKETETEIYCKKNGMSVDIYTSSANVLDSVEIFDLQGRLVYQKSSINSNQHSIALDAGVYIVRAHVGTNTTSIKVVI